MEKQSKPRFAAEFFRTRPIFTTAEFYDFVRKHGGSLNRQTQRNVLHHFTRRGVISSIRRGIYCSVPPGTDRQSCPVDGYLLASKLAENAVIAYHAALELHGRSYSLQNHITYVTDRHAAGRVFQFRDIRFRSVMPAAALVRARREDFGVTSVERLGQSIRVTNLERTLVDVLDRPKLSGGWEEIWRSLETVPYFDLDVIVEYALLLGKHKTIALVGLYLEQHAKALMVTDAHLSKLQRQRPREPQYVRSRAGEPTSLVSRWNLIVPESITKKLWEEMA